MTKAKMTSKGQITIPKAVRDKLGLKTGSLISFDPYQELFLLRPLQVDPLDELEGFFDYSGPSHTVEEMNEAVKIKATELYKECD